MATAIAGEKQMYSCNDMSPDKVKDLYSHCKMRYPWSVYAIGYLHVVIYATTMFYSGYQLAHGGSLWWACLFGWSYYCVFMIGHESCHHTMSPSRKVNNLLAYFTLDCLMVGSSVWKYWHHEVHHRKPMNKYPKDQMRLFGPNVFVETFCALTMVLKYWAMDFADSFFQAPALYKIIAIAIRLRCLLTLPLNALIAWVVVTLWCVNYCALLTHAIASYPEETKTDGQRKSKTDDILHQLRTSLDLFPNSELAVFLSGALNLHCVHHVFPSLPRALHSMASNKLTKLFPTEHRAIHDFKHLAALWVLRHDEFDYPVEVKDLPKLAQGRYAWKLIQDIFSVGILVGFVIMTPKIYIIDAPLIPKQFADYLSSFFLYA